MKIRTKYEELNIKLREAGVDNITILGKEYDPVESLVNSNISSKPYLNILLEYLPKLNNNQQEMVIRAMSEKHNKEATPILIDILKNAKDLSTFNIWAIGNALYIFNNKNYYQDIIQLARKKELGIGRQMLISLLPKIKTEESFQALLKSLNDKDLKGHAIEGLGKFGDQRASVVLKNTEVEKGKFEYHAKKIAVRKLENLKE